jgi:hypothetical protein
MQRITPIAILLYLLILPFCAPTSKAPTITPDEQSQREQIEQALSSEHLPPVLSQSIHYRLCGRGALP